MEYHLNIHVCPFYLIQMLSGRAQLILTDPRINFCIEVERIYRNNAVSLVISQI